jgi:hypothetical protein
MEVSVRRNVEPNKQSYLLFDMTFEPAMGIGSMQEVDLSPLKGRPRSHCSILSIWLHPANIPRENNIVRQRAVTAVLAFAGRNQSDC